MSDATLQTKERKSADPAEALESVHRKDVARRETLIKLSEDNTKLVEKFGASLVAGLKEVPNIYTFRNGLMYSHRDLDTYMERLKKGEKCSIVSGFNASATPHIGHLAVFDTNLAFQKQYGVEMFIPISDDESYVSGKVETQHDGLVNSLKLAKSMIAFGFDLDRTHLIIDQLYTNIYNLAIKYSRDETLSQVKAVHGYSPDQNIGLHFYPVVQTAHIMLPEENFGIPNVLVPIGPDEDAHLRVCRDLAERSHLRKPAVVHSVFMPGLDGQKMSKSKGNAIFLLDKEKDIKKKVMSAYSGGRTNVEEHRRLGGNPDVDVAYLYMKSYFLTPDESRQVYEDYKKGRLLSGELKKMLLDAVMKRIDQFQKRYAKVTIGELKKVVMTNEDVDLEKIIEKAAVFDDEK